MDKIPVIVIFAPTATGKTALCLDLFGKGSPSFFNGQAELISADSMQVYRKLDIGTAKPSIFERKMLPHHLVDILDYKTQFTVSDFVENADVLCKDIYSRGKIPLVAGGTGFYIRNFLLGAVETPPSDEKLRETLKKRILEEGNEALYNELKKVDEESARKINVNDSFRIVRALEVYYLSGKKRSDFELKNTLREKYDFLTVVLERIREVLYERINERVEEMFSSGLEMEVRSLMEEGADPSMPGMKAIGYREWFSLEDVEKIKTEIKHSSRKYAKKQYTYMKDIPGAFRVSMDDEVSGRERVFELISEFLSKYGFCS